MARAAAQRKTTEAAEIRSLTQLAAAEEACTRCTLYRDATQVVPGEGKRGARLMLVGEQPGDREDIAGRPFVGPAGRILDQGLRDAGIDRGTVFVTNAVKHFKHEQRGKRRLHKRPNPGEIKACRWWVEIERRIVKPQLVVAMGATAAHSLFDRSVTIGPLRGRVHTLEDGTHIVVTIHPSAVLRVREEEDRDTMYRGFVDDLAVCARFLRQH